MLTTKRLILRPLVLEDVPRVFAMSRDAALRTFIPDQVYRDEAHATDVVRALGVVDTPAPRERPFVLGVALRDTGELIGHVGLSAARGSVEIGYAIDERLHGRGFATEAVTAMTTFAFVLGLPEILGIVAHDNAGSRRVLEKTGFAIGPADGSKVVYRRAMTSPILEAERVRLRPLRADDRDGLFALFGDPEVARYGSTPAWTSIDQADAYLAPLLLPPAPEQPASMVWAVADRASDALIGDAMYFQLRADQRRAEIGYSLLRSQWGKGLGREAVARLLAFGVDELALRRIEADIDPRNTASIALCERFGFQREGLLRERWVVAGDVCDTAMFGLLARELRR